MPGTTVIFVHGFISGPECWNTLRTRMEADTELMSQGFSFLAYQYPTKFLEVRKTRRIPSVAECGAGLGDFIDNEAPDGQLMLIGHSMGGLVIQSYLAGKIGKQRGADLERIRSVIMLATPNRGSMIIWTVRKLFDWLRENEQEEALQVLDKEVAETSETIIRSLLAAKKVDKCNCPIPFRVFWGMQDDIVTEVSARGSFTEASPLPGDHHTIIQPDPDDPRDQRYVALKNALLNPVGHPSIYEISRFEVNLTVSPSPIEKPILLSWMTTPIEIHADNIADREIRLVFSKQNRCYQPYEQMYRSIDGYVKLLSLDGENEALPATMSEYYSTGKRYAFIFSPDQDSSYGIKLRIFKGFGEGQRSWHNHMFQNARYKLFRFTLNLKAYQAAGYELAPEPAMYVHAKDNEDHALCDLREPGDMVQPTSPDPWLRTWEVGNVRGGVIDVAWDFKKPA